ncbi:MAG: hypothetical protein ACYDHG_05535 [Desulfomonilaceae bacterium]
MCQPRSGHRFSNTEVCACGCCDCRCATSFRRFFSTNEEEECLKNYQDQLRRELAGLEERLKKYEQA